MFDRILFRISKTFILVIFLMSYCQAAYALTETMVLKPGFNFVSLISAADLKPSAFKALDSRIENIFTYDAQISTFFSHNDGDPFDVTRGKGYIVKLNSQTDVTLSLAATTPVSIGDIKLYKGFNLIGFSSAPGGHSFKSLMESFPSITSMHRWDPILRSFIAVARNGSSIELIDGLNPQLAAGETYFIKMSAATTLNYDGTSIKIGGMSAETQPPVISPAGGTFTSAQQVSITCATQGATIKYTTDGTTPSASNGLVYSAPFNVSANTTVNAMATASGMKDSPVTSAVFTFASTDFTIASATITKDAQGNYLVAWTTGAPTSAQARVIVMAGEIPHPGNDKYFKETISAQATGHSYTLTAANAPSSFNRIRISYVFSESSGTYKDVMFADIK